MLLSVKSYCVRARQSDELVRVRTMLHGRPAAGALQPRIVGAGSAERAGPERNRLPGKSATCH